MSNIEAMRDADRAERFLGAMTEYHENGYHVIPVEFLDKLQAEVILLHAAAATASLGSQL